MFQWKIDETFKDIPNVFGIADNILVIGYNKDGTDYDETVKQGTEALPGCQFKIK